MISDTRTAGGREDGIVGLCLFPVSERVCLRVAL